MRDEVRTFVEAGVYALILGPENGVIGSRS